jgi:hypothetical protein
LAKDIPFPFAVLPKARSKSLTFDEYSINCLYDLLTVRPRSVEPCAHLFLEPAGSADAVLLKD